MESLFSELHRTPILVYLDDIIVFTDSETKPIQAIKQIFQILRNANLKIKPSKCRFLQKEIIYLAYIIGEKGIKVDPTKADAVRSWKTPRNAGDIQKFLGFCNYYRHFVKNFAFYEAPLRQLTLNQTKFVWQKEHNDCFENLTSALTSTPILCLPNPANKFIVDTDASDYALGSILSQVLPDGKELVIYFASKVLSDVEKRYSTTRKELLAVIWSLKKFKPYLIGIIFTLRTDHKPLTSIQSTGSYVGQLTRWIDLISEYDFDIQHRSGRAYTNADTLSRYCCAIYRDFTTNRFAAFFWIPDEIRSEQMNDKTIQQFMKAKNSKSGHYDWNADPLSSILIRQEYALTIKNGILYRKYDSSN
ncbi:Retrovirus-related Pol polyprotein [Thelohanellus kitauei]|uniref:Retrovirus-related Pol polyprotein n=1 Tax=Thelohanellus kitauei TaxID=669202 RepID=A0A0C2JAX4_THEKT|nr:Retrovirus-related Pol polyprotein [Thelohanellus kitauei]